MPPPFRFDIIAGAPPLFHTLNAEQMGMWVLLIGVLWNAGPITSARVIELEREHRTGDDVKRTLSLQLHARTESERFLLEQVTEGRWSFAWLEQHREKQESKSQKAQASGKSGGRGNTPRRKAAREKANALQGGESERFRDPEKATKANALEAEQPSEKRTLSDGIEEAESERFADDAEGARVGVPARISGVLFSEEGIEEEESERAEKTRDQHPGGSVSEGTTSMFANSAVATLEAFRAQMAKQVALGIDVDYYYHAVADWSAVQGRKKLRTASGWIATARTFMRGDAQKKGVRMLITAEGAAARKAGALDYLNLGNE